MALEIPIFPLRAVLFPQGLLPLKIFEQRYLDMTKACIRDASPFGVCLLRDGAEVGAPAVPYPVGCTALIQEWDMPHLGLFHLLCRGESVFRIAEHWAAKNGLLYGLVELQDAPPSRPLAPPYGPLAELLAKIIDKVGTDNFPSPVRLDDADWVACRLAEVLPLEAEFKQQMLELRDPQARLERLRTFLQGRSVAV
ncbi:MAG TPA: LON peptidase substrate-binding domain-containing protein [Burkholderiales bacterium]|nr:LON peptidase substrate-binding domain-containing protein [Burkholderiales bacterium]